MPPKGAETSIPLALPIRKASDFSKGSLGQGVSRSPCWFESRDVVLGAHAGDNHSRSFQTQRLLQGCPYPQEEPPGLHVEVAQGTHRHGLDIEDEEMQSHGHNDSPQQPDVEPRWHPQQRLVLRDTTKTRGQH